MTNQTGKPPAEIGVVSAASIGIGGMVGTGGTPWTIVIDRDRRVRFNGFQG